MGYRIGLKQKDNSELYLPGVSIEQLYDLYCFDSQFRNKLIHTIEQIEIMLRTQIAYLIAMKYGADGLENPNNFQNKINSMHVGVSALKRLALSLFGRIDMQLSLNVRQEISSG